MKQLMLAVCFGLFMCAPVLTHASEIDRHNYIPPNGVVPDAATAVQVAEAILVPIYGKEAVVKERPYNAKLRDNVWVVTGSIPTGVLGGVASIEISKEKGTVLRITHGQ